MSRFQQFQPLPAFTICPFRSIRRATATRTAIGGGLERVQVFSAGGEPFEEFVQSIETGKSIPMDVWRAI